VLVSESNYTLALQSESEYTLWLNLSGHHVWIRVHHTFDWIRVHVVLESEFVLDIHHYLLLYTPCWSRSYFWDWLDLVLQSEYNFCLSPSRPLLLQSEYNFYLSPSRPLLPQSEYTFCLNPSKPSACVWGDHTSERGDHTSERESVFFTILPLPSPEKSVWSVAH
jgi:hypothetical protein